jgi:hypothetical protein
MTESNFQKLDELSRSAGAAATIDELIELLTQNKKFHELFDALLLKKKFEMSLPLVLPTSFDDVPDNRLEEFEQCYIETARRIGEMYLAENDIPRAWNYLRMIREPEKVAQALDALDANREGDEETENLINVALHEGVHPVKGLELLLHTHGTCNTITALDQQLHQLKPEHRQNAAALLVRNLHSDLTSTLRHEVERKSGTASSADSLTELIADGDWLFADGNYHIDVSHLNSVVRFARSLDPAEPELKLAMELAEYGTRLAAQFQYPGDAPFDDFYPAHLQFFKVIVDIDREEALDYFRAQLDARDGEDHAPFVALVLVDLLIRCQLFDEAVAIAAKHLTDIDPAAGFSFAQLCQQAGRMDPLRRVARVQDDLVAYTAALLQEQAETSAT